MQTRHPSETDRLACYKDSLSHDMTAKGASMGIRLRSEEGVQDMGLKAPSIITFMVSVIVAVVVLMSYFFSAEIPGLKGNELWALLGSYAILMLGCMVRGL
jgi:hypothetical protein